MTRPRLLDLFCGAGGAAVGYHRAGFDVAGIDLHPQPNYPYCFRKRDALDLLRRWDAFGAGWFDAIHASPPCQAFSALGTLSDNEHPDLHATPEPTGPYTAFRGVAGWIAAPHDAYGAFLGMRRRIHACPDHQLELA